MHYLILAKLDEFPGLSLRAFAIGDEEIVVINTGRNYYAVRNLCTHRGERLSDGLVEEENLVCAYHEAVYDLSSGQVIEGPAPDPVITYPVRVDGDYLQVGWETEVPLEKIHQVVHEVGLIGD